MWRKKAEREGFVGDKNLFISKYWKISSFSSVGKGRLVMIETQRKLVNISRNSFILMDLKAQRELFIYCEDRFLLYSTSTIFLILKNWKNTWYRPNWPSARLFSYRFVFAFRLSPKFRFFKFSSVHLLSVCLCLSVSIPSVRCLLSVCVRQLFVWCLRLFAWHDLRTYVYTYIQTDRRTKCL